MPMETNRLGNPAFAHPYLLLNIENINVYDGTNDAIRGAFSVLRFDTSYMGPNGRGYVVLVPMQNEVKIWTPPLASLQNLRISLTRPNGTLVSNAVDDYRLTRIEYDATRSLWIKLITDKYFDKHEFTGGDLVYLRGCKAQISAISASSAANSASSQTSSRTTDHLLEFLNRQEGHEVIQVGTSNQAGFFQNFYIMAPSTINQAMGRMDIDGDIVDVIQTIAADTSGESFITGDIMNTTLQMTLSMQVSVVSQQLESVM